MTGFLVMLHVPRDPRGRSDCVEKALDVTLTTDSISESPNSPMKSLSGERECRGRIRVSIECKSLSERPNFLHIYITKVLKEVVVVEVESYESTFFHYIRTTTANNSTACHIAGYSASRKFMYTIVPCGLSLVEFNRSAYDQFDLTFAMTFRNYLINFIGAFILQAIAVPFDYFVAFDRISRTNRSICKTKLKGK
uniref:Uncharacterized protein n=1 Tax=Glossina pallidipes TaxID=7398 RepID=A0A1B0AA67_GLOPL